MVSQILFNALHYQLSEVADLCVAALFVDKGSDFAGSVIVIAQDPVSNLFGQEYDVIIIYGSEAAIGAKIWLSNSD